LAKTINGYLKAIQQKLVEYCDAQSPFSGEIEVDESFASRIKGKGCKGVCDKRRLFIFLWHGTHYTYLTKL